MNQNQAHQKARDRSKRSKETIFVVNEEQNDGTMYDTATSFDLETFYNGLSANSIVAAYENGEFAS